jgi:hypothetical protein
MMNSDFFKKKKSGTYQQFQLKKIKLWISKLPTQYPGDLQLQNLPELAKIH